MSAVTPNSVSIALPENPDLRHLKNQARDLMKIGGATPLTQAQYKIAKRYGYAS